MEDKIEKTLAGLKDFQRSTVAYVYDQLYHQDRNKILIADEVGLGKTIVAKGLIAKAYRHFVGEQKQSSFRVVYVCSNQALARQNLGKLNFTEDKAAIDFSDEDDRLTSLAYDRKKEESHTFSIKAFTPATSFDDRSHAGKADERRLLYRLLCSYKAFDKTKERLQWILKGSQRLSNKRWKDMIRWGEEFDSGRVYFASMRRIRHDVRSSFRISLNDIVTKEELPRSFETIKSIRPLRYWTLLKKLCNKKINEETHLKYNFQKELISSLRFKLSQCCIKFLDADIFILDEFQRYKQLIGPNRDYDEKESISPAHQLARDIFKMNGAKVLMLSATPFKPYTNDFDEQSGEVHHKEFEIVLKFLMDDLPPQAWKDYEKDKHDFFHLLRHPQKIKAQPLEAMAIKSRLESLYRIGIVRTERQLAASQNRSLVVPSTSPIMVEAEDIGDFVALDRITQHLNTHHQAGLIIPIEYVKSSPYALSFLDTYAHKKRLHEAAIHDPQLLQLLKKSKHAWINIEDINSYKKLIPPGGKSIPNAKFRLLLNETVSNGFWKLLWIPPSIPYYPLSGAFKDTEGFSKTLLFSSWKMVPRMVAGLVSYEAERLAAGVHHQKSTGEQDSDKRYYFQKKRTPRPLFTFKLDYDTLEPGQMNNFMLTYPCLFLASIYDPARNVADKWTFDQILEKVKEEIKTELTRLDLNQYASGKGDWRKWYWITPLIVDRLNGQYESVKSFFENSKPETDTPIDGEATVNDKDENTGKKRHFELAHQVFSMEDLIDVGYLDEERLDMLAGHLSILTLGSPSIAFLRSLLRYESPGFSSMHASYTIGSAFLTMLNKPESIAVIRLTTFDADYWQQCLQYLIDGNIQALLDEYVYLLRDSENLKSDEGLQEYISDVLSIRTASIEAEGLKEFQDSLTKEKPKRRSLRAHFAIDFGSQKLNTAKSSGRQVNIRQAFNSPFRPFVLSTTSIGQEGLDFHFFCKKIFHWNLPSNPIDFEQREGRINRYKGLVIRQSLAKKYSDKIGIEETREIWSAIFSMAEREKETSSFPCDLIPFWHTAPIDGISIERFVPLYPFSRDHKRYSDLLRVLTYYRLTFGQPRQDELIDALHALGIEEDLKDDLYKLMIDLAPISFMQKT